MNGFDKFIHAFQYEVKKPPLFGWYHLVALAIILALAAVVIVFRKKISHKTINITLLAVAIILLVLEAVKQCVMSMDVVDGVAQWEYAWKQFPFQFCSAPMYLYLLAGILRKGKVYDTLLCFLATFGLFGGLVVCIYPSTVLSSTLFLSIHTMIWHGAMLVVGVMLLATKTVALHFKSMLKAGIVFSIILVLAELMNIIWHFTLGNPDTPDKFNMFYISPYGDCDIPVLHDIKNKAPYVVFLISYVVGFSAAACIVMGSAIGIDKLYQLIVRKKRAKAEAKEAPKE